MSTHDDEAVVLGVNVVVLRDGQLDEAAASRPAHSQRTSIGPVRSAAFLLLGVLDLAVGRPKHRLVLGDSFFSLVHPAQSMQVFMRMGGLEPPRAEALAAPEGSSGRWPLLTSNAIVDEQRASR